MSISTIRAPTSMLDPYKNQALLNPWPLYIASCGIWGRSSSWENTGCLPSAVMMSL
jgi:hypothetical protein